MANGLFRIDEAMEDEIVSVLKDLTGAANVAWDKQGAFVADDAPVKPDKDFIFLDIASGPNEISSGFEYTPVPGEVGLFNVSKAYTFTLSVNFYTNNAHLFKIARISTLLRVEEFKNRLKNVGVGLLDTSDVSDLSEFDETRYNLRSHMDIVFSYIAVESNVAVGEIERFKATGTLGNNNVTIDVQKPEDID